LVLQEAASLSTHCADGSTWLMGTLVQVPSALGSAHDWQAPAQGELQQYPCAQERPIWHSPVLAQTAPGPLSPQVSSWVGLQVLGLVQQVLGLLHCSLPSQVPKHAEPLQI
jgi:hypothetical protein